MAARILHHRITKMAMPAFVEMIIQTIAKAAPIENSVSDFVAEVLENTANKLSLL